MALNLFRYDTWVKTAQGPAIPGAQVFVCLQPANVASAPPTPLAPVFSDPNGSVPITQPILTDGFGHADFYAVAGLYTLIIAFGGKIQQVYVDQSLGGAGTNPSGPSLILQTNGIPNTQQSILNLQGGVGVSLTSDGSGNVTINGAALQTNGVANTLQSKLNLKSGTGITLASDSLGGVLISGGSSGGGALGKWTGNWGGFSITSSTQVGSTIPFQYGVNFTNFNVLVSQGTPTSTQGKFYNVQSSGGNNGSGYDEQAANFTLGILQDWFVKATLVGATSSRYWIAIWDGAEGPTTQLNTLTPAANLVGFRWDSVTGGNIRAVCQTSAVNQTVVDTGVAPSATPQTFEIVPTTNGTAMTFYINGVLV